MYYSCDFICPDSYLLLSDLTEEVIASSPGREGKTLPMKTA